MHNTPISIRKLLSQARGFIGKLYAAVHLVREQAKNDPPAIQAHIGMEEILDSNISIG